MNSVRTLNSSLPSITQSKAALFGQSSPLQESYGYRANEAENYALNFDDLLKRNQAAEYTSSTQKSSPRVPAYPSTMIFDENEGMGIQMSQRPSKQSVYTNNYYQVAGSMPTKKRSISVQKPVQASLTKQPRAIITDSGYDKK